MDRLTAMWDITTYENELIILRNHQAVPAWTGMAHATNGAAMIKLKDELGRSLFFH